MLVEPVRPADRIPPPPEKERLQLTWDFGVDTVTGVVEDRRWSVLVNGHPPPEAIHSSAAMTDPKPKYRMARPTPPQNIPTPVWARLVLRLAVT